jgi:hypothetical protein
MTKTKKSGVRASKNEVRGWHFIPEFAFAIFSIFLIVRLFHISVDSQCDFQVYWEAIHAWMEGKNPYGQYSTLYGFVYKYPPWTLPIFTPFAWVSFNVSRWIWTALTILGIAYSMFWLVQNGVHRRIVFITTLMYWWLWQDHAYVGQITVLLMALSMWCVNAIDDPRRSAGRVSFLSYLFSLKIFSMIPLVGLPKSVWNRRTFIAGFLLFLATHVILLLIQPEHHPAAMISKLPEVYRQWMQAASVSGAVPAHQLTHRWPQNHSFTGVILREMHVDAAQSVYDVAVTILFALGLGLLWYQASKKLTFPEKWAGWLSVGVVSHPLSWHHSFVLIFPLSSFALQAAWERRNPLFILLSFLGTSAIALMIPQVIGVEATAPLEAFASKSWGVVICAWVLIQSRKPNAAHL